MPGGNYILFLAPSSLSLSLPPISTSLCTPLSGCYGISSFPHHALPLRHSFLGTSETFGHIFIRGNWVAVHIVEAVRVTHLSWLLFYRNSVSKNNLGQAGLEGRYKTSGFKEGKRKGAISQRREGRWIDQIPECGGLQTWWLWGYHKSKTRQIPQAPLDIQAVGAPTLWETRGANRLEYQ